MQKIAYLVDSSSGCHEDPQNDIYLVPLSIIETNNGQEKFYKSGIDITLNDLQKKLDSGSKFKTGQTSIGEVEEKVNKLLEKYDLVIGIPIDSQLSGTYQSWKMIENEIGTDKFNVLDTKDIEVSIKWWIDDIKEYLAKNPYDIKKLNDFISKKVLKKGGTIIVSDVSQLIAGGRLKGLKAFFVKTLKFHILIKLLPSNGILEYFDKSRSEEESRKKCVNYLDKKINWSKNGIKRAGLISSILDDKKNLEIINEYKKLLPKNTEIVLTKFNPVIAVHTGLNTYALYLEAN